MDELADYSTAREQLCQKHHHIQIIEPECDMKHLLHKYRLSDDIGKHNDPLDKVGYEA